MGRNKNSPEPLEKATSGGNEVKNLMAKIRNLSDIQQQIAFTEFDLYQLYVICEEFAKHQEIAKELQISFYFCKSYHSWERGANENTNGLIRQYIPKGTDFSGITDEFVSWVENKLNNRSRKRLGYLSPNEKFNSILTN